MNTEYTAGDDGLLYAFELTGDGGGNELGWAELDAESSAVQWIHLDFTEPEARAWLRARSGINRFVVDALLDEDSRPRFLAVDNGLLITLRGVNMNPGSNPEDMVSIRLWVEKGRIISTRRRRLLSVVKMRENLQKGEGPRSAGDFLVKLTHLLDERIGPVVDSLDDEIEAAEDVFADGGALPYSGEFSSLRRQSARIRRYLAPQRDALERLSRETNSMLTDDQRAAIREEADQITRHLEDLDLVRERAILAQEELLGRLANEQNSRMYVLSLVAAIFLPLSFVTGLMGMNVAGLPGTDNDNAFLITSVVMLLFAAAIVLLFKWRDWL